LIDVTTGQGTRWVEWLGRWGLLAWNLAVGLFVFLPALAPWFEANGWWFLGWLVRAAYHPLCHQLPSRSLVVCDLPMALCARCFAIYAGFWAVGVLYYVIWLSPWRRRLPRHPIPWPVLILCLVPMALDGGAQLVFWPTWGDQGVQWHALWESTNVLRVLTGGLAGLAAGAFVYPLLVRLFSEALPDLHSQGEGGERL
jgi:uncharacterized membrane protein